MFGLLKKKISCPKCDSRNIKVVKPSSYTRAADAWGFPFRKPTPPLNVCRDCGFSWEDR